MSNQQFFITLPSNSLSSNTAAEFTTSLPLNINLDDEWEVGHSEIIYGNTWFNITEVNNRIIFFDVPAQKNVSLWIAKGRYESVTGLVESILKSNEQESTLAEKDFQRNISIAYNEYIKRCQIMINTNEIHNLKIHSDVAYMLGFEYEQIIKIQNNTGMKTIAANYPVDMSGSFNHLYIYCNIVKPQIVGNVLAPLLQIVSVEGKYVDTVCRTYITPHYVPVLKNSFSEIEISIRNDQNKTIKFEYGKTIVKLHFKKVSDIHRN